MLILFGTRSTHLKTVSVQGTCKRCSANGTVELVVFQRIAHIFWVPVFPIGKTYAGECYKCKRVFTGAELLDFYPVSYGEAKGKIRTPWWSFSVPLLIASLVLIVSALMYVSNVRRQFLILIPKRGDIYERRLKGGGYTLLKVARIRSDTVYVFSNSYVSRGFISMKRLMSKSEFNFGTEATPMLKDDLVQMVEEGEITGINRP